jgi:hypothetical protein
VRRAFGAKTAMTERDSDIEFDFFEDLEPQDPGPPERTRILRPGGPPGGPPRRPPQGPPGVAPPLRLAVLIGVAILVIVLLVFAVKSCSGSSKKSAYENYLAKVSVLAKHSEQLGANLTTVLTTPGLKNAELATRLDGYAEQQRLDIRSAQQLSPPSALRSEQANVVESLQFRAAGLTGLAATFRQTVGTKDVAGTGAQLALQAQRLTTSDVIWDDLFKKPSADLLNRDGVSGVAVPDSNFVSVTNLDFSSPRFWVPIVQRLNGAASGGGTGGLHGTALLSVLALPSQKQLDPSADNIVTATTDLGFAVNVQDSGDSQEVGIKVTLTIQQQPTPIVKTVTIPLINPGDTKQAIFRNLGQVQFATNTIVKVDVAPVPLETRTSNNSAQYKVIFSVPGP